MRVERTVTTDRPLEVVYAYLSDFTHTTQWDPGTVRTEKIRGDGGVGTTYHNVSTFRGRETELVYTVVERVENAQLTLEGVNKTVTAVDSMTFAATASGGTTVTYAADFTFKGIAKLAEPFLRGAFDHLGDEAEAGLQKATDAL
ncbi:SRPBCC family protein [Dermatophilaceae bacterium Soc4.6]